MFEDNQYIQAGSEDMNYKDGTPCFKFDLTERLKNYFFYVESLDLSDQPMSSDVMIRT